MIHFFTSINNHYLNKARVLARSLRTHYPSARIILMLCDRKHTEFDYSDFDEVWSIEDLMLPVQSLSGWIFSHNVVELCTAVKPWVTKRLLERGANKIIYLDPDIMIFSPMVELTDLLREYPIVLTPHVTVPASSIEAMINGEMLGSLRHGVFNLGFFAVTSQCEGPKFVEWWAQRCLDYCFDDKKRGLFTDQRWLDLAPCFFSTLYILRLPSYNLAGWNMYYRQITGDHDSGFDVNGSYPLRFIHFSGFDMGTLDQRIRESLDGTATMSLLISEYGKHVAAFSGNVRTSKGKFDVLPSGLAIPDAWRRAYRDSNALQQRFPDPYGESAAADAIMRESRRREGIVATAWRSIVLRLKEAARTSPRLLKMLQAIVPDNIKRKL
jgi:hypothetical protein